MNLPVPQSSARARWKNVVWGAIGFAGVSLLAFSLWAFLGRWFGKHGGEGVLYAAIAAVFLLATGLVLHPLMEGEHRLRRFTVAFVPAFLAYALVWSGFWFWLKFGLGEWLGALVGSLVFVSLWRRWNPSSEPFLKAVVVFFVLHTLGYFAGGYSMEGLLRLARQQPEPPPWFQPKTWVLLAKLSWGVFYGLGLGAGLGWLTGGPGVANEKNAATQPTDPH